MKFLTLLPALVLIGHAPSALATSASMAVVGAPDSSLLVSFLGAVTMAAGLMRLRRRR